MTIDRNRTGHGYAGKVAIRHAVEGARAAGVEIGSIEMAPDGTIRIFTPQSASPEPVKLYDRLKAEGRL